MRTKYSCDNKEKCREKSLLCDNKQSCFLFLLDIKCFGSVMKSNINTTQLCPSLLCAGCWAGVWLQSSCHQPRPVLAPHSPAGDQTSRGGMAAGDNCISIELLVMLVMLVSPSSILQSAISLITVCSPSLLPHRGISI